MTKISPRHNFGVAFSVQFNIDAKWMEKNNVFDPTLDVDTNLFIDPFLLRHSKSREFAKQSFGAYCDHFDKLYKLLKAARVDTNDSVWKAARRFLMYSEAGGLSGTCIGYSKRSTRGRGMGKILSMRALATAKRIIDLGIDDPEYFSLLSFFEDGIGPDMISDMVINVTWSAIAIFNQQVYEKLGSETKAVIPRREYTVRGQPIMLPQNPYADGDQPIILLPADVLKHLPIISDAREIPKAAEHNENLRNRVNEHVQDIWKIRTRKDKDSIRERVFDSAAAFQTFLDLVKLIETKGYDLRTDPDGLLLWRTASKDTAALNPISIKLDKSATALEQVDSVCRTIIDQFKQLVEERRLGRLLFAGGKPRPEKFSQLLFLGIAISYCEANNLDIAPEADAGAGPVDFKVSSGRARVLAEIKLSTNTQVVSGYNKQLGAYLRAEDTRRGHYVVIDVGKLNRKWIDLQRIRAKNADFQKDRHLHLIDGKPKPAASRQ